MKYKSNFLTEIELLVEKGALKSPKICYPGGQQFLDISVNNRNNDEKQSFLCEINVIDLDLNCQYNHAHYQLQDFMCWQ